MQAELEARDKEVLDTLRNGDHLWTDENMRGRLSELQFMLGIPEAMMAEQKIIESYNRDKEKRDAAESE